MISRFLFLIQFSPCIFYFFSSFLGHSSTPHSSTFRSFVFFGLIRVVFSYSSFCVSFLHILFLPRVKFFLILYTINDLMVLASSFRFFFFFFSTFLDHSCTFLFLLSVNILSMYNICLDFPSNEQSSNFCSLFGLIPVFCLSISLGYFFTISFLFSNIYSSVFFFPLRSSTCFFTGCYHLLFLVDFSLPSLLHFTSHSAPSAPPLSVCTVVTKFSCSRIIHILLLPLYLLYLFELL